MIYKLKIPAANLLQLLKFLALYNIQVLLSYRTEDGLFDNDFIFYVSAAGSEGITGEEKERLIAENFGSNVKTKTAIK